MRLPCTFYGAELSDDKLGVANVSPTNISSLESLGEFALTFNMDIDLAADAKACLYDGETLVKKASLTVSVEDGTVAKADFGDEPLYYSHTYSVVVAENSVFPKGETEGGNAKYTAVYTGTSYMQLTATASPEDGSTVTSLRSLTIKPDFPEGCGFVYLGNDGNNYKGQLYKGGKDGELVAEHVFTLNASGNTLVSDITETLEPNSVYTVVIPEDQLKAYLLSSTTKAYREDYKQPEWVFTYKTAPLPINVLGSSVAEGASLSSLGVAAFYVSTGVTVAEDAKVKLMQGDEVVKEATVEVLGRADGTAVALADFSTANTPLALTDNTAYTVVLPQGSLLGADGIVTNAEKTVNITGAVVVPETETVSVTLTVGDNASSVVQAVKGKPYTVTVTPETDWTVESLTVGGTDVTSEMSDGSYTIAELTGDTEVIATLAYDESKLTFADVSTGIASVEGTSIKAYSEDGEIVVKGLQSGDIVTVYTVGGMRLAAHEATRDSIRIAAPTDATYIVKVNGHAIKLAH